MKSCYFCKGKLERREVEFDARWGDKRVVISKVPAEVCIQCGEEYFSRDV